MDTQPKLVKKTFITGILFLVSVFLYLRVGQLQIKNRELIEHLLLVLSAMFGVHFLERVFLWKEIAEWNRRSLKDVLDSSLKLVNSAAKCGLQMIYSSRKDVTEEIISQIKNVNNRVWILGIAFSDKITISEMLNKLYEKKLKGLDVKILLLDPLTNAAIFRSLLESSPELGKSVLETDRTTPPPLDPYFFTRLYNDSRSAISIFEQNVKFQDSVRFYPHNPNCWMIIVDDYLYHQPYTFGRGNINPQENYYIGSLLPVFKFKKETNVNTFNIYEDHFIKLWLTSNSDLSHILSKIADGERIVAEIFKQREDWFKHINGALFENSHKEDRRIYPRQALKPGSELTVTWSDNGDLHNINAFIRNYSREGMCLGLTKKPVPKEKQTISLKDADSNISHADLKKLLEYEKNRFKVIWANGNSKPVIGLHAYS